MLVEPVLQADPWIRIRKAWFHPLADTNWVARRKLGKFKNFINSCFGIEALSSLYEYVYDYN